MLYVFDRGNRIHIAWNATEKENNRLVRGRNDGAFARLIGAFRNN